MIQHIHGIAVDRHDGAFPDRRCVPLVSFSSVTQRGILAEVKLGGLKDPDMKNCISMEGNTKCKFAEDEGNGGVALASVWYMVSQHPMKICYA